MLLKTCVLHACPAASPPCSWMVTRARYQVLLPLLQLHSAIGIAGRGSIAAVVAIDTAVAIVGSPASRVRKVDGRLGGRQQLQELSRTRRGLGGNS